MSSFIGAVAVAAWALTLSITGAPAKPFPFADLAIGQSVSKLIASHGSPSVVTTDVGHVWTWDVIDAKVRVTTDDDGIVRVFDLLPSPKADETFSIPADPPIHLTFGAMDAAAADARLASILNSSGNATLPDSGAKAEFRAYKTSPDTEAVLLFDDRTKMLAEAFFGERDFLVRDGLIPIAAGSSAPHFTAASIVHEGAADYPHSQKQGDAFVRIAVDKNGAVSNASIFVSSGDVDLDRAALASARQDTFTAAKLEDQPVASVVFHKEEFRTLPPAH